MTLLTRAWAGVLLAIALIAPATLSADTVQLTVRDGRLSLVATNATPSQIFDAWSRIGGILIVNADRMPAVRISVTLENVSEEQALDTLLRPVSGYLARRRTMLDPTRSIFDRIVILATPAVARDTTAPSAGSTLLPQAPRTNDAPPATVIQQGPGVMRLIGPDGRPVADDQDDAPPAPAQPYGGGDAPDARRLPPPRIITSAAPPAAPAQPTTPAPVGSSQPGMPVPTPPPQTPPR